MNTTVMLPHSSVRLLEQARQMISASQFQNAEMVLDALVRVDPENIEAWKMYLSIRQDQAGLDWVKDRAFKTQEVSDAGKREILGFYLFLVEQMRSDDKDDIYISPVDQKASEGNPAEDSAIRFELLTTFDYSLHPIREDARIKRPRVAYNFVADIAQGLAKELSRHPLGKKIAAQIEQSFAMVNDLFDDSGQGYAHLIESPYFKRVTGIVTLAFILWGARLSGAHQVPGYFILGISFFAGRWWFREFLMPEINLFSEQVCTYLQESENKTQKIMTDTEDRTRKNRLK